MEMSARALLLQAADLLADPGRPPGWGFDDPAVLLSTGRLSANIAGVIAQIAPALDGLQDALQRTGARFLDVGAGVAALSIALCETWPGLHVVGLEPWAPAFALAEAQVASSDVADRVELRPVCVEDFDDGAVFDGAVFDGAVFDVAWLAGPLCLRPLSRPRWSTCTMRSSRARGCSSGASQDLRSRSRMLSHACVSCARAGRLPMPSNSAR